MFSSIQSKETAANSEATTNSGSNKPLTQTDDDEEEDEPVYIESSPCSRWQKRRETVSQPKTNNHFMLIFVSIREVAQRDIPGIDASYLAMDTEEGVEVVWNEVLFSERKISDIQHVRDEKQSTNKSILYILNLMIGFGILFQNKISDVFDKLIELNHMNIVKFHGYWQDRMKTDDRPRVQKSINVIH